MTTDDAGTGIRIVPTSTSGCNGDRQQHDPAMSELMPAGYAELLAQVKADVLTTRLRAARTVNVELIALYWRIGGLTGTAGRGDQGH